MRAALFACGLSLAAVGPALAQDPTGETQVEEIVVQGERLETYVRQFVSEVGAPAGSRGLARWPRRICVGVVNLQPQAAQYIADRVSQVALDLGLEPGEPGCRVNIAIVFSDDAAGLSRTLVEENRRSFRTGGGGLDRGSTALQAFVDSTAPVRWWQVSIPVDSETNTRAVRIPGDEGPPRIAVFAASRLNTQIRDDLNKVIIIVDMNQVEGVQLTALADYLAFIAMAQVDPAGDTGAYDTVLNLFSRPGTVAGLTDWDVSYLDALYTVLDAPQQSRRPRVQAGLIAGEMLDGRVEAQNQPAEAAPAEPTPEP